MWIDIPAGFTKLLNHKTFNWNFEMEAEEGMATRVVEACEALGSAGTSQTA